MSREQLHFQLKSLYHAQVQAHRLRVQKKGKFETLLLPVLPVTRCVPVCWVVLFACIACYHCTFHGHPTLLLSMAKAASDCTNEQSRKIPLLVGRGYPQYIIFIFIFAKNDCNSALTWGNRHHAFYMCFSLFFHGFFIISYCIDMYIYYICLSPLGPTKCRAWGACDLIFIFI